MTPTATPEAFFLRVTSPKNESVVSTPVVQVTGETTPDAVVSVAGQPVEVDADGRFAVELTLVEGPSFIEVIASDFSGHQLQEVIAVIFAP